MDNRSVNRSETLNKIVRAVILIVVSLLLSILSVSFAVHHMRLMFEEEFKNVSDKKIQQTCDIVKLMINGDEIIADPVAAAEKYDQVLSLALADTSTQSHTTESYALFLYSDGKLTLLTPPDAGDAEDFQVAKHEISDWLSADNSTAILSDKTSESVLVPIADSTGRCVGVFEYKCDFKKLDTLGAKTEKRILISVIISVAAGIVLFGIQSLIPKFIRRSGKGGQTL